MLFDSINTYKMKGYSFGNNNLEKLIYETMLNSLSVPNDKPKDVSESDLWATHTGKVRVNDKEIMFHRLSDGNFVFDIDDVDNFFKK